MAEKPVENIFSHNILQCRQLTIWSERFYTRWNPPTEPKLTQEGYSGDLSLELQHIGSLIYGSGNTGMAVRLDGWLVVPHAACHMMITV